MQIKFNNSVTVIFSFHLSNIIYVSCCALCILIIIIIIIIIVVIIIIINLLAQKHFLCIKFASSLQNC